MMESLLLDGTDSNSDDGVCSSTDNTSLDECGIKEHEGDYVFLHVCSFILEDYMLLRCTYLKAFRKQA